MPITNAYISPQSPGSKGTIALQTAFLREGFYS